MSRGLDLLREMAAETTAKWRTACAEGFDGIDRTAAPALDWRGIHRSVTIDRTCSLPEQLPARDALATLAVSRDADEEHPDEHAPGSRGHVMRRAVGCDFVVSKPVPLPRITLANPADVYNFQVGGSFVNVIADPDVPPGRAYLVRSIDAANGVITLG